MIQLRHILRRLGAAALLLCLAFPATAQDTVAKGPVTGLDMPRFVSMKGREANARGGPSMTHRVEWVFHHRGTPLIVTGEYGHWRRVVDRDGIGGWVHYALLSGVKTVVIDTDMAELHRQPSPEARIVARAERGAIARLGECQAGWCRIRADGASGWILRDDLWGVSLQAAGPATPQ